MHAQAQSRCDCSTILDRCDASVTIDSDWIAIESDHEQCARVDYLVDGLPFVSLVTDGRERQSLPAQSENPRVLVQSCQVCLDNTVADAADAEPAPRTVAAAQTVESEVSRLLAVKPKFPSDAASNGIEGYVEVSFTVTALGRVEDPRVTAAEPPGVFDEAALAAVSRWRYNTDEGRAAVTLSHRFDFKAQDAILARSAPRGADADTVIDSLIARAAARRDETDAEAPAREREPVDRNHCIREQVSFNFGEMVEVDLMNACGEPLMVYSCTEGMGRYQHRWVCRSAEHAQSILVRPGEGLAGNAAMIEMPEGLRTFRYAEELFVSRPPNTEYWWLACAVDEPECRGSGRLWVRSMNGKAANIDPQLWTQQSIARSY